MIAAILTVAGLTGLISLALALAARRMPANPDSAVEQVNALLPQQQCAQCGFPGCRPYAQAIIDQQVPINRCPPGGEDTIQALAHLLQRSAEAPDPAYGLQKQRQLAVIDESACIGCARCLEVCPVDAIIGAPRYMHTILSDACTGCELCLPPCPVDCIRMEPAPA